MGKKNFIRILFILIFYCIPINAHHAASSELPDNCKFIDIGDEIQALHILAESNIFKGKAKKIDLNKNGIVELIDAIFIMQSLAGIYDLSSRYIVKGRDNLWGEYYGFAEIKCSGNSEFNVYHVQEYNDAYFEGDKIAFAWEGKVLNNNPLTIITQLNQVGFIRSYKNFKRDNNIKKEGLFFRGVFEKLSQNQLYASFKSQEENCTYSFEEEWIPGAKTEDILWRNLRTKTKGHDKIPEDVKNGMFLTFLSFYDLEQVKPYILRSEFKEAIHYWINDPTNFDFYRQNPNIIRVIQKIPDHISIVEERIRNRAYRQKLCDKAIKFDNIMNYKNGSAYINEHGMLVFEDGRYDIDSLEWTGIYIASQALRYLSDFSIDALDNMINSLKGIMLCYDIAPKKGDFARTVRTHKEPIDGNWEQGIGDYVGIDWLKPANNDMVKGYFMGFTFSFMALSKAGTNEELIEKMIKIMRELLEHNEEIMDELNRPVNTLVGVAMVLMMDRVINILDFDEIMERIELAARYELLYNVLEKYLVDLGNGSIYEFGISDWSGNQLNLETLLVLHTIASFLENNPLIYDSHLNDYKQGMKNSLNNMNYTNLGFFQLVCTTLSGSWQYEHKRELEDAIWLLRSFPCPKVYHNIDWGINPTFCISPFPNLPWKLDWTDPDEDRTRSLIAYPLFEQNVSNYQWKADPFAYKNMPRSVPHAADYLISYWFGRYFKVIGDDM